MGRFCTVWGIAQYSLTDKIWAIQISFSFRLSLTLSCPMNLADYPLDKQLCLIDMASCAYLLYFSYFEIHTYCTYNTDAYTTDDIIYEWKEHNPVQLKSTVNSSLPSFILENYRVTYCSSKTTTGCINFITLFILFTLTVFFCRWIQLFEDRTFFGSVIQLLLTAIIHTKFYAGGCILGIILAR